MIDFKPTLTDIHILYMGVLGYRNDKREHKKLFTSDQIKIHAMIDKELEVCDALEKRLVAEKNRILADIEDKS